MNIKKWTFSFLLLIMSWMGFAQDIYEKWITVDNETGAEKSIVNIYQENGKVYGRIVEILNPSRRDAICTKCEGEEKNKPILDLVIIKGLEKNEEYYENGTILDPNKGKTYKCRLALDEDNKDILQVRGYIAFFYATQYWKRVKN